jgi:signal transduction histidine kinase
LSNNPLSKLWNDLISPHDSIKSEELQLKSQLLNITSIVLFLSGFTTISLLFIYIPRLRTYPGIQLSFFLILGFPIIYALNKKGRFNLAATLMVILLLISTLAANFTPQSAAEPAALVVLPVFVAAFFLHPRMVPTVTLIQLVIVGALLLWAPGLEMPEYLYAFTTIIFLDLVVNLYVFHQMRVERVRQSVVLKIEKDYSEDLENKVEERTNELIEKTKEIESFSYSVSHDLRAPLRHISGFGQILEENYSEKLGSEGKEYLQRMINAAQRMNNLIDDLLKLSRISQQELFIKKVKISDMVNSIIEQQKQYTIDREIEFTVVEGINIQADENLIRIALENLINNALKFTEDKSPAIIEFGANRQNDQMVYFIRDNGIGFNDAYHDKLFVPFQRLHNNAEIGGTGIGLSIVKRIIDRHSGNIWVESEINVGTTFYFSIS